MPRKSPDKPLTPRHAWQPFTPRGVAAFAHATFGRLLFVQLLVALLVAAAVVTFLRGAWFPVITNAVERLPQTGSIRNATLSFPGESPSRLAENARLAIVVDLDRSGAAGNVADVEVTFERNRVAICGALGCWWRPYERGFVISFNRPEVEPGWGAWQWPIVAIAIVGTIAAMFVMWWAVSLLYLPWVKLIAFFSDRALGWGGAWRLSAAALLPGACVVAVAIVLYGFGAIDLLRFALLYALHAAAGLLFVITSPYFLPRIGAGPRAGNPFTSQRPDSHGEAGSSNPFSPDEE